MKAYLAFKLPEEREEHELCLKAGAMSCVLWDIENYMRSLRKYDEREVIPKNEIIDKITDLLRGLND